MLPDAMGVIPVTERIINYVINIYNMKFNLVDFTAFGSVA